MTTTFSTDGLNSLDQQRGSLTYEVQRHGYKTWVTVDGTFSVGRSSVSFRKPYGKKFVYLCEREEVLDVVLVVK